MSEWMALTGAMPALALMAVVDLADAKRPEPHWQVRKVAVLGGLAFFPCVWLQRWLAQVVAPTGLSGAFFDGLLSAALLEEGVKGLVLWLLVWRHPAFDERLDGIVYATRAGLGFALVENVLALAGVHSPVAFVGAYLLRAFFAVPCHAICAGFLGDLAARRRFDGTGPGFGGGLLVAVLLHGAYDVPLAVAALPTTSKGAALGLTLAPVAVVVGAFLVLRARAVEALRRDDLEHHHPERGPQRAGAGFVLR